MSTSTLDIDSVYTEDRAHLVGNILVIIFSMLFLSLFMAYIIYRSREEIWPPMGMTDIPLFYPTLSTLIIFLSSIFLEWGQKAIKGYKTFFTSKQSVIFTFLLGIVFLASQVMAWFEFRENGIYVGDGIFPSILYAFSWVHAFHLLCAIILLVTLFFKLREKDEVGFFFIIAAKLWHFLGVVWLMMYLGIFVF